MQHAGEDGLEMRRPGRWLLQWARQEQAGEDFEQGQRDGLDLKQRLLSEGSELFREKGDKTVPGP